METRSKDFKYLDFVMILFVTVVLLSNLLSSAKIIDLGFSIGPIAFLFDAGTLVFPISYIFGDVLTEVYGYKRARRIIWFGFFAMALFAIFIWLAGNLPSEQGWQNFTGATIYGYSDELGIDYEDFLLQHGLPPDPGSRAYSAILGSIPSLAVASLLAYLAGSFSNSYVLARMKVATQGKWLWARTIGSTIIGQGIDTAVFIGIATLLGVFEPSLFISLLITNYVLKVGIEIAFTPITLPIVQTLKHAEGVDVFDRAISFNPFRLDT